MYSKIILDCLKAEPTTTILVPGTKMHFNIQYILIKKDLPKPREAINMGNGLFQNSCKMAICIGCNSILKSVFAVNPKYWGSLIIFMR